MGRSKRLSLEPGRLLLRLISLRRLIIMVASGWSISVGIAGWSMGGGHGPFSRGLGIGVDQVVEIEIVTANSSVLTVNSQGTTIKDLDGKITYSPSTDLYWAIRGGGASAWGIVVAYTFQTHPIPTGGLSRGIWVIAFGNNPTLANNFISTYTSWSLRLSNKWSGLNLISPVVDNPTAPPNITFILDYLYLGPNSDSEFQENWNNFTHCYPNQGFSLVSSYQNSWVYINSTAVEKIYPIALLSPTATSQGGIPSVLVERNRVSNLRWIIANSLSQCVANTSKCIGHQIYHDLTDNSNHNYNRSAVGDGMYSAVYHLIANAERQDMINYYSLGDNSYFGESAYDMVDWKGRLWGDKYQRLLGIKESVDPDNVFWCNHCVGDKE